MMSRKLLLVCLFSFVAPISHFNYFYTINPWMKEIGYIQSKTINIQFIQSMSFETK
jgi:hypothetical protein